MHLGAPRAQPCQGCMEVMGDQILWWMHQWALQQEPVLRWGSRLDVSERAFHWLSRLSRAHVRASVLVRSAMRRNSAPWLQRMWGKQQNICLQTRITTRIIGQHLPKSWWKSSSATPSPQKTRQNTMAVRKLIFRGNELVIIFKHSAWGTKDHKHNDNKNVSRNYCVIHRPDGKAPSWGAWRHMLNTKQRCMS